MTRTILQPRIQPKFLSNSPPLSFYEYEHLYATLLLDWSMYTERSTSSRGSETCETLIDREAETAQEERKKRSRAEDAAAPTSKRLRVILLPPTPSHTKIDPLPISRQIFPPRNISPLRPNQQRRREEDLQNVIRSFEVVLGCRLESWRRFEEIAGDDAKGGRDRLMRTE